MPPNGHVFTGAAGLQGFDANRTISPAVAAAFRAHGYRFCVRYVRRKPKHSYDLTAAEASAILAADLGLMVVQHVAEPGWRPDVELGMQYGYTAASEVHRVGVPAGVTVWCDLEGVGGTADPGDVIDYCNAWHQEVAAGGFVPGLYVGDSPGLTARQLYAALKFTHYWGAYNLNRDQEPATRGLQMKQTVPSPQQRVPGYSFEFQVDGIRTDALGGRPTLLGPESWLT
jgi:hypothetical protein